MHEPDSVNGLVHQLTRVSGEGPLSREPVEFSPSSRVPRARLSGESPMSLTSESLGMKRKVFWTVFMALGAVADLSLPLWWALVATIPIGLISWWLAYCSDWF